MNLGAKLKTIRHIHKLSQDDMAIKLCMSQPAYNKYENEKTPPTTDFLERLVKTFDVPMNWLLLPENEPVKIENIKVDNGNSFVNTNNVYTIPQELMDSLIKQQNLLHELVKKLLEKL